VWSQGVVPYAEAICKAFSQIHELHFQAKEVRGLHNYFGCYNFAYRRGALFSALAYRSKWPNGWAREWFYMNNYLNERSDIKGTIQTPTVTCFGYKKTMCYINFEAQAAIVAFNAVCTHIGTRDLVQEFLAFKTWPLGVEWEMSKMFEKDASDVESRLIRLHYNYKFESEFGEHSGGWLDYVEAKHNEMFGNYSKPKAKALHRALAARKRRRLNRVFDAIDFFCPDYVDMNQDSKNMKRKITTKWSMVLMIQLGSTPQASEEILVQRVFWNLSYQLKT
jgi:hypothetical protein